MHRASYWKTTVMALTGALLSLAAMLLLSLTGAVSTGTVVGLFLLALPLTMFSLVACSGLLCLWRDGRIDTGKADLYALSASRIPEPSLLSRLGFRILLGPALRPGDIVRVKALSQIQRTLSADGMLDGLPFMVEMVPFCGKTFRVHRRIDKINDMRHKTGLRRTRNVVTLTDVRCSGLDHGGCQAECQILWKDSWLERLALDSSPAALHEAPASSTFPANVARSVDTEGTYICQMTRLWEASQPMSRLDIRQDLRPLFWGNIGLGGYLLAMLTRLFNQVQRLRGGAGFPAMPATVASGSTGSAGSAGALLADHQPVSVRSREEISATLKNGRTAGLWYDRDMVRFCGRRAVLRKRVHRIIHEATGKMVIMKAPCVVLEGVVATGEFLRMCPQHEYIFWRDAWLHPLTEGPRAAVLTHLEPNS